MTTDRRAAGLVRLHWRLPPANNVAHLGSVALHAQRLGYDGVVLPPSVKSEGAWAAAAALVEQARHLAFSIAIRPESMPPTLAAQLAAALQLSSGGRLLLHLAEDSQEQAVRLGAWPDHDAPYARAEEFLAILHGAWSGVPLDYFGRHYRVSGATVASAPQPQPLVVYGDASDAAARISARHADVHLLGSVPPHTVGVRIFRVSRYATAYGREVSFGVRLGVIARDTAAEAWAEAERLLGAVDARTLATSRERLRLSVPLSQQRLTAQYGGRVDRLETHPNIWAGPDLLRAGAGLAVVGSHEEVAQRIEEYHNLGVDHFFVGGCLDADDRSHDAEVEAFGAGVLPLLRRRGLLEPSARVLAKAAA